MGLEWAEMPTKKDGTLAKLDVLKCLQAVQAGFEFANDSVEDKLIRARDLFAEESTLKKVIRVEDAALHQLTKETIEGLSDNDAMALLKLKWVTPIVNAMNELPHEVIRILVAKLTALADKYAVTYVEVTDKISKAKNEVVNLVDKLRGNEFDMKGLNELQSLLRGDNHGQ